MNYANNFRIRYVSRIDARGIVIGEPDVCQVSLHSGKRGFRRTTVQMLTNVL